MIKENDGFSQLIIKRRTPGLINYVNSPCRRCKTVDFHKLIWSSACHFVMLNISLSQLGLLAVLLLMI